MFAVYASYLTYKCCTGRKPLDVIKGKLRNDHPIMREGGNGVKNMEELVELNATTDK